MSDTKVPKTLSAKNTKLSSFINFYNKKLIDLGFDKDKVDNVFKIFDNDIPTIISLQNEYLDFETSYIQEYKKQYKLSIQNQKNNDKQNKKYNKELDKWNNKFYKIFHKTLISDPAFRHHIIDITPFHILDTLIPPSDNLPLPRLIHLKLLQSHLLANHSYNNPKLDLNLLPNLPNKPTPPPNNYNPLSLASTVDEKVDKTEDTELVSNDLKDVTILNLNNNKYLCDNKNNVYDFKTHNKIGSIECNDDGILTTPITINFN
jgi:hypothetical protein